MQYQFSTQKAQFYFCLKNFSDRCGLINYDMITKIVCLRKLVKSAITLPMNILLYLLHAIRPAQIEDSM